MTLGQIAPGAETDDAAKVTEIRSITGLSQPKFAKLLRVDVGTMRNWEQGRREPTGPAQALLVVPRPFYARVLGQRGSLSTTGEAALYFVVSCMPPRLCVYF
jgi:hypothetical protein